MKKYLFILLIYTSLFSYDSRSIGMGGITTIPLNMFGGGQNPAFVDIAEFELSPFMGIAKGLEFGDSFKSNIFFYSDITTLLLKSAGDGGIGLNFIYKEKTDTFAFAYTKHTRIYNLFDSLNGDVIATRYSKKITNDSILNFGLVYGHYFGVEYSFDQPSHSNIYRAGGSLYTHFDIFNTTIGYEKVVSTSKSIHKSKDTIGYELKNLFGSPFGLQSGVSYVENRFVIPRGISFDYQRGVNDAPDWVLQIMQFPIKYLAFVLGGIYEYIPTLGQSHKVFDFVFSKNKFDSINLGIAYDGDEQYALNMSYGIAF